MAVNGLAGTTDPEMDYLHCFCAIFACKQPYLSHHGADTTCTPKYIESFPMMRLMCGTRDHLDLETGQRETLLAWIQDGLYWNLYNPARPWATSYNPKLN
jgi:hypothetical protein